LVRVSGLAAAEVAAEEVAAAVAEVAPVAEVAVALELLSTNGPMA